VRPAATPGIQGPYHLTVDLNVLNCRSRIWRRASNTWRFTG